MAKRKRVLLPSSYVDWHQREARRLAYIAALAEDPHDLPICRAVPDRRVFVLLSRELDVASSNVAKEFGSSQRSLYRLDRTVC